MTDLFQSLRPQSPSDPGTLLPLGKATLDALTPDYMKQPTGPVVYPSTPGKMATVDPAADAWPMAMIDATSMLPTGGGAAVAGKGLTAALSLIPKAMGKQMSFTEAKAAGASTEGLLDTLFGQSGMSKAFNIVKDTGDLAGRVWVTQPSPKTVKIEMIKALDPTGELLGREENTLGPKEIRSLIPEIKRHFPDAEKLIGTRISGARENAENRYGEVLLK